MLNTDGDFSNNSSVTAICPLDASVLNDSPKMVHRSTNIPIHIAVTNDGVKYIAKRIKEAPENYIPDEYFAKELEELNRKSRANEITPAERMVERERIIIESLVKEFYGRIDIIDGRK